MAGASDFSSINELNRLDRAAGIGMTGSGYGGYDPSGLGNGGPDYGVQAVQAMGLFGKVRDMLDVNDVRQRSDQIADALRQNGGNMQALPSELVSGRNGTVALGQVMQSFAQSQEGQQKFMQAAMQNAETNYSIGTAGLQRAQQQIASGDSAGAGKTVEQLSSLMGSPYSVQYNDKDNTFNVMFPGDDGQHTHNGETYTAEQMIGQVLPNLLGNNNAFARTSVMHDATVQQHNLATMQSPDKWVTAKDKDGAWHDFVPVLQTTPGQPTQTLYYNPETQQTMNLSEMQDAGFGSPVSKAGGFKQQAADLAQEKADNAMSAREQALALKSRETDIKQQLSEGRVGLAGASVDLKRQRLALEAEKLSQAKDQASGKNQRADFDTAMKRAGMMFGLQTKNGAWGLDGDDGSFHAVDSSDPRFKNAMGFVNSVMNGGGIPGAVQGVQQQPQPSSAASLWDTLHKR